MYDDMALVSWSELLQNKVQCEATSLKSAERLWSPQPTFTCML